jgi:UDPglucose 6-dehydrogenase
MKITIIGTGYVGLVAGTCFADAGNDVQCVDKDANKIAQLERGVIPIYEPGLKELVEKNIQNNRLSFTTSTEDAVKRAEIIFLAVGTPSLANGEADLKYVRAAAEEVARGMNGYKLIVNKSTVPVGTQKSVTQWIGALTKHDFDVVSNPEFLKEGSAIDDFLKPERIVIGADREAPYQRMVKLYAPFVRQGNPIIKMEPISAEMTKYACNSFLATRISFMNELAVLCDEVGGDIEDIRKGMITDSRIGKHFLYAGVGYGGSCFPKDVRALLHTAKKSTIPMQVINATETANVRQKSYLIKKIHNHYKGNLKGKIFGIWGLAFKPNTDDIREAPALVIIRELIKQGAQVQVFDPVAMENTKKFFGDLPNIEYCRNKEEACQGASALILITEWTEFRSPDLSVLKGQLSSPVIFDGRNIFDPDSLALEGFTYYGIGREFKATHNKKTEQVLEPLSL